MKRYIIRLDDASEYMDVDKWLRMEELLDRYNVRPIFGIIPDNKDGDLIGRYRCHDIFWSRAQGWILKGWTPAMHGCEHRYVTKNGGINPVNKRSEFAGLSFEDQREKIKRGWDILREHNIQPDIFFAPSHTFDHNTLKAIKSETPIRIISDTAALDVYKKGDFYFIPQQSGRVRRLPFKVVTFCYHPNMVENADFIRLEAFLEKHHVEFIDSYTEILKERHMGLMDRLVRKLYFAGRKMRILLQK